MIIVENRELLVPNNERYIGTSYDNNSEVRVFRIRRYAQNGVDIANLAFRLDIKYSNDNNDSALLTKEVDDDYITLTWTITSSVLQVPGTVFISLRGTDTDGTVKWSSFIAALYVETNINTPGTYTGSLTELEQMEASISNVLSSEASRVSAETARVSAETSRASAETARATAESTRASEFTTLKNGYDAASKLAKSYAVGGTGTREGEDTDNAKYYKEHAQAINIGSLKYASEKIHFGGTDSSTSGGEASSIVAEDTNGVAKVYTVKDTTARSSASSAQTTANTAVSNAATAQSTANTAVSNAATAQTTANAALPKSSVVQTNQNDANTVPSSALLYSVSADKDNKLYTSAFWNYFSWKYISPLNVVPTALNTAYSYQNDLLKNKPFVVVSFAGVSACIFCANTNKECSYSDYNPDNPYWRQIITAGYNPSTGTVWAKVRYKGSSQSFASLAITDVQYFG